MLNSVKIDTGNKNIVMLAITLFRLGVAWCPGVLPTVRVSLKYVTVARARVNVDFTAGHYFLKNAN